MCVTNQCMEALSRTPEGRAHDSRRLRRFMAQASGERDCGDEPLPLAALLAAAGAEEAPAVSLALDGCVLWQASSARALGRSLGWSIAWPFSLPGAQRTTLKRGRPENRASLEAGVSLACPPLLDPKPPGAEPA